MALRFRSALAAICHERKDGADMFAYSLMFAALAKARVYGSTRKAGTSSFRSLWM